MEERGHGDHGSACVNCQRQASECLTQVETKSLIFFKKTSLTLLVQKSVELTVGKIKKNDFAGLTDVLFVGVGTG